MRLILSRNRCRRTFAGPRQPAAVFLTALVAIGLLAGCGEQDAPPASVDDPALPSWIVSVEPEPGEQSSVLRRIEVNYVLQTGGENVRLSVDGTDVTSYADFGREQNVGGPGSLFYDFEAGRAIVPMEPGEHTATLDLVELDDLGEQPQILDTFSWSFTIQ